MSRRKTAEQLDAEAQAADEAAAERYREQQACSHYRCSVAEWWFSGTPRLMCCDECGAENFIEEPSA